jgi:hypothetical protein
MGATYRMFKSSMASWDTLFQKASDFATGIGRERLISISHSEDKDDGVVVVWYWQEPPPRRPRDAASLSQVEREIEENQ